MGYESNSPKGLFIEQRVSLINHQIKFLSNQIDMCRKYNTIISRKPIISSTPFGGCLKESKSVKTSLNPWFLTGFSDAESSFSILIQPNLKYKTKWRVKAVFAIGLHKKDIYLLKIIQAYLGVGKITKHGKDSFQLRVESFKELQIVIKHFEQYPLISVKVTDYILFKKALDLINTQEHLNEEGLLKLIGIKASLNLGLNDSLKNAFPNWKEIQCNKPDYNFQGIPDPNSPSPKGKKKLFS